MRSPGSIAAKNAMLLLRKSNAASGGMKIAVPGGENESLQTK
jgi:hypothetical protein